MLLEILCNKFAEQIDGQLIPRGKIVFHEGLNTVLGDKKAENSIGKSTFLLVVDFCFGGDDYCNPAVCNVTSFVDHHTIQFAYKFGDRIERYSRNTLTKEAFDIFTSKTVEATKVIELYDEGGELFRWSWAKKKELPESGQ